MAKNILFLHRWISLLLLAATAALVSGCHTPQRSVSAPIPPNWYDSYLLKDSYVVDPIPPDNSIEGL